MIAIHLFVSSKFQDEGRCRNHDRHDGNGPPLAAARGVFALSVEQVKPLTLYASPSSEDNKEFRVDQQMFGLLSGRKPFLLLSAALLQRCFTIEDRSCVTCLCKDAARLPRCTPLFCLAAPFLPYGPDPNVIPRS